MSQLRGSVPQLLATIALALGLLIGCGGSDGAAPASDQTTSTTSTTGLPTEASGAVFVAAGNPELLSEWGQLSLESRELTLAPGVTPYTLNSALFSDHAQKLRTVWLPDGADPADYSAEDVLSFPVGTVITKTFYYPLADGAAVSPNGERRVARAAVDSTDVGPTLELANVRLVETRILAHRSEGWVALPYVWNDQQTEAMLSRTGDLQPMVFVDGADETAFPYVVPNVNQCAGCHATNHTTGLIKPIGPKARHLNIDVDLGQGTMPQLEQWAELGLLSNLPASSEVPKAAVWDDDTESLDDRARAYLDVNCAHCHNENGPADTSGLFLETSTALGPTLGVCKPPVAAGTGTGNRRVGINPGHPEDSIFVFRMTTTDPGAMMPELGRGLIHQEGVDLITEWIESLDGECA